MNEFAEAISFYSPLVQRRLNALRLLILETAIETEGVGKIEEALRWNQPSFLTPETRSGSTIRIDGLGNEPTKYAMYFHCQSGLVELFRARYDKVLTFVSNRAIIFDVSAKVPVVELKHCISLALTHHLRKKSKKASAPEK